MKFKKYKGLLSSVLAICLLATSTVSAYAQVATYGDGESVQNIWDGYQTYDDVVPFDGGDGTQSNPYLISNGDQLHNMVKFGGQDGATPAFYKLTADIYLNDISNFSQWSQENFDFSTLNNWAQELYSKEFVGTFNGNGYTIYGMYASAACAGLIPRIGVGTTTIRNLNIDKFYVHSTGSGNGAGAAALIGRAAFNNQECRAIVSKCAVTNGTCTGAYSAAILAYRYVSPLTLTNTLVADVTLECTLDKGGIFADGWTTNATVSNCLFIGLNPLGTKTNSVNAYSGTNDVYTDTDFLKCTNSTSEDYIKNHANAQTIQIVDNYDFIGEQAAYKLDIDWDNWKTTDKYPRPYVKDSVAIDSTKVWDGTVSIWTKGSGTASNPYLIENASQLAYFANNFCTSGKTYYALVNDIYLNDIGSDVWESEVNLNNWIANKRVFTGEFDGRGHVIYGLYYNSEIDNNQFSRVGLIGQMTAGAVIKNVGLSHTKIYGNSASGNNFTGGIVGLVSNWSNGSLTPDDVEDGTVVIGGVGKQVPIIENCFIDHNSLVSGYFVGGIVGAAWSAAIVKNCFATCELNSTTTPTGYGAIIGDAWVDGSVVINCFASAQNADPFCSGASFANSAAHSNRTKIIGSYAFSFYKYYGANYIKLVDDRLGQAGYSIMAKSEDNPDGLDFENVWQVVEDGTPVLKSFVNENHTAEEFSDKDYRTPGVTLSFETGDASVVCKPITKGIYSNVTLPTPKREGYNFAGWYVYYDNSYNAECYQCEYNYGYMPIRDLTLYAKWDQTAIYQDFQDFPNTAYDMDMSKWKYNKYSSWGTLAGYYSAYARGSKSSSIHRLNTEGEADLVVNYKTPLEEGKTYKMSLWITTDTSGTSATLSLVHNTWPDYLDPIECVEEIGAFENLQNKNWVESSYTFTAKTPWVSIRTTGGASLYIDDISFIPCEAEENLLYSITNQEVEISGVSPNFAGALEIPDTINGCPVTKISDGAFNGCHGLTSANIPSTVNSIGKGAFYNCDNLEDINVDDANTSYTSVDGVLFTSDKTELIKYPSKKSATSYTIPDGTTTLVIDSFNGCDNLKDITVAASVSKIDNYAIIGCNNLESITVAENNANYNSKNGCNAIIETATNTLITGCKQTVIPDGVTAIGGGAFYENANLGDIVIPASVTQIGDTAFKDCHNATFICKKNSYAHNFAVEKDIRYLFQNEKTPSAPVAEKVEVDKITLVAVDGCEYSCDGINWQQSNVFENLLPCTEYTFYQRYAATSDTVASASSVGATIITGKLNLAAPAAPTVQSITTNSVILVAIEGCEYSRDGVNWQSRNVFVGLAPATEYTFYQRYAETEIVNASAASEALFVTTLKVAMSAPSAPVVQSVTENSVTLVSTTGCEYSCDGVNWQKSNIFTALQSGTEYTFYQRYAETDMTDASAASEGTKITTKQSINGWIQKNGKWYYYSENVALTGWRNLGVWYYFDDLGVMQTGWVLDGSWYYMDASGAMVTGWQNIGGTWYYFNAGGSMATGWVLDGAWYYMNASGAMVTGWQNIGGIWYYFNTGGSMATGWVLDGSWYYMDASGAMVTGWQNIGGAWYFFNSSGVMLTGWQIIGDYWYYFYSDGSMASNCHIDGCWLSSSGAWV